MFFGSDNTSGAHPDVIAALVDANSGFARSYGADDLMTAVRNRVRDIFDAPEAAVYLVATGTAANALSLAALCPPWGAIYCHRHAHIEVDECGAPEFYTGGSKLVLIDGDHGKIEPSLLQPAIAGAAPVGVHNVQPGMISMTNVTEFGAAYSVAETNAIGAIARQFGIPLHLDGARLSNAQAATGATLAELTWKAGVDAVSFGGTKNGLIGAEAVVLFDPTKAWEFELRRKRAGHLFSKHRFLSAQMAAYLKNDLWIELAQQANASAKRLAEGLAKVDGVSLMHPVDANMIFFEMSAAQHRCMLAAGAVYGVMSSTPLADCADDAVLPARLVCSWSTTDAHVDQFLETLAKSGC